jgi:hypothetical protein
MTPFLIFVRGRYLGVINADDRDEAIDRAAVQYCGGDDSEITVLTVSDL